MTDHVIDGAELPIISQAERGPGVIAWETRKEENNAEPFKPETITINFEANKAAMFEAVRSVL